MAGLSPVQAPAERAHYLMVRGSTLIELAWRASPLLSLPLLFALTLSPLRSLAPTRPRAAGAAAGLLAGSLAAVAYALHCTEMALGFRRRLVRARHGGCRPRSAPSLGPRLLALGLKRPQRVRPSSGRPEM